MSSRRTWRFGLIGVVAFVTTSLAAAADDPVPWPAGHAPEPRELTEQVHVAAELYDRETAEEFLEAIEKGEDSEHIAVFQEDIDSGRWDKERLFRFGDALFAHEFRKEDGYGATMAVVPLQRVHNGVRGGLDTFSCAGCHSVGGPNGAGASTQNTLFEGDGDRASSAIVRNPPGVLGLGFVQALGIEMTTELRGQRDAAIALARKDGRAAEIALASKGVSFGTLRVDASGQVDTSAVQGVSPDLEIRPFGRKGIKSRLRRFIEEAARGHFGIQSHVLATEGRDNPDPARLGNGRNWFDPDGDGKQRELEEGALTATVTYFSMLESPVMLPPSSPALRERWTRGSARFDQLGCSHCHKRELPLAKTVVREMPDTTGGPGVEIDLLVDGDQPKSTANVMLFSDLKRHDMGPALADLHQASDGLPPAVYITRPLWGLAETAPYLHDGRAATIPEAILTHGGEAKGMRDAFAALSADERADVHVFLLSLTRAPKARVAR